VHLVGFITKKFVTMHRHMNVKIYEHRLIQYSFSPMLHTFVHNCEFYITITTFWCLWRELPVFGL